MSGQGLDIEMEIDPNTAVLIDQNAKVTATNPNAGSVNITSTANTTSFATGNAGNYGGDTGFIGGGLPPTSQSHHPPNKTRCISNPRNDAIVYSHTAPTPAHP